jgi:hypothetical protein
VLQQGFTANWTRRSATAEDEKLLIDFSRRSRCRWKPKLAGVTIRIRSASPRSFSYRIRRPAMMVLPAPASSASGKRTRASFRR